VVVAGGGDAAFENALLLAEVGCHVTLAVRSREPQARREFRRRVAESSSIEVLLETRVEAVLGQERVEGVRLAGASGPRDRPAEALFVKIGVVPNTEWCRGALPLDPDGYPIAGADARVAGTRAGGVGDLLRPAFPSLAHAVGSGARAAAGILRELEG
jgi:thioredoxin reductase